MMATTKVGIYHDPRKRHPWIVRWFGEYDPATDEQRRYSKGFRLKRDAERFQASKQAEFEKGAVRDRPDDIPVDEFCRKYLQRRTHEWAEKTRQHIACLALRLTNYFGEAAPIRGVTPERAAAFWSSTRGLRNAKKGSVLSRSTRNRLLRDSKTMFRYAVDWGYIISNPFQGLRQVKVGKKNRRDWRYVTPHEYRALLRTAPDLRWKVFYALGYTSAARFGELFNLTEDSFDLDRGRLLIRSREGSSTLPPFRVKDHEDREVPLPKHAVRLVRGWLRMRPSGSPLILLTPDRYERVLRRWHQCQNRGGAWINNYMANNVIRDVRRHARIAKLPETEGLTVHCIRKSCGQNWADHLPMNVVKELMGHANISTTAEFYSTVTEEHEAHAQWIVEALTIGKGATQTDARMTPDGESGLRRRVG